MRRTTRVLSITLPLALLAVPFEYGAGDIDPAAVEFTTPANIKWVRNEAGTNEQAILFGDPTKEGPYVIRLKWLPGNMSRPHYHMNDRFFIVISGTWWLGTGDTFDPGQHGARARRQLRHSQGGQGALRRREGRRGNHPGVGHGPSHVDTRRKTLGEEGSGTDFAHCRASPETRTKSVPDPGFVSGAANPTPHALVW